MLGIFTLRLMNKKTNDTHNLKMSAQVAQEVLSYRCILKKNWFSIVVYTYRWTISLCLNVAEYIKAKYRYLERWSAPAIFPVRIFHTEEAALLSKKSNLGILLTSTHSETESKYILFAIKLMYLANFLCEQSIYWFTDIHTVTNTRLLLQCVLSHK